MQTWDGHRAILQKTYQVDPKKATMTVNLKTSASFRGDTSTVPSPRCHVPDLRRSKMPCGAAEADALAARGQGLDERVGDFPSRPRTQTGQASWIRTIRVKNPSIRRRSPILPRDFPRGRRQAT